MPMSTSLHIARNVSLLPHYRFLCSQRPPEPKNWWKLGRGHGKAAGLQMLSAQKWAFMCLFQWDSSFLHLSQKTSVSQQSQPSWHGWTHTGSMHKATSSDISYGPCSTDLLSAREAGKYREPVCLFGFYFWLHKELSTQLFVLRQSLPPC